MTPLRIAVIGAAGMSGSRIVAEARARGHEVTAVGRDAARLAGLGEGVRVRTGDASDPGDVARLAAGQDVVVQATRPAFGREQDAAVVMKAVLAGLAGSGVRLTVVGGAGSLVVPGSGGRLAIDDPSVVPPQYREFAQASNEQYEVCRTAGAEVDWTYLSPSAVFEPGERTGRFRTGTDELLVDADGRSSISAEDAAIALLDEIERPRFTGGRRFTVGY
ncbi:NAD(P)H-binding protein [Streptomyces sp. A7024]|uniref:NAD(P)H-binding protein n=1 Tax=Streptomyces coryli TaxID=1128680 RepID=A0A6G4TZR2_9ACTN|nr:NAD(P)H-binding protein [Streptomyces coryli]NGN65465.1 NAD(P)H-binding protein [Streptomyces coryli]